MSIETENNVFNRLFEPGTGWDNWVKYPFYPDYAVMGEVEKAGLKVGATAWSPTSSTLRQHQAQRNHGHPLRLSEMSQPPSIIPFHFKPQIP